MYHVLQTSVFSKWLSQLRDGRTKARNGGDKATQDKDIVRARRMANDLG